MSPGISFGPGHRNIAGRRSEQRELRTRAQRLGKYAEPKPKSNHTTDAVEAAEPVYKVNSIEEIYIY